MYRGGSRAAATSKMERFVITVNGFTYSISFFAQTMNMITVMRSNQIETLRTISITFCANQGSYVTIL